MIKDIYLLLETTNNDLFEEQADLWPGMRTFKKFAWDCKCGDARNCFRKSFQSFATQFPTVEEFITYFDKIVEFTDFDSLAKYTEETWKQQNDRTMMDELKLKLSGMN